MAVSPVERAATALSARATVVVAAPAAVDVESRLQARRRWIRRVRRRVALVDAALLLLLSGSALLAGYAAGSLVVLGTFAVVFAHVCGADGPRSMLRLRSVLKASVAVAASACVAVAVLGMPAVGREIVLAAAASAAGFALVRGLVRLPGVASRFGLGPRRRLVVGDPHALKRSDAHHSPAVRAGEVIVVKTRAEHPDATGGADGLARAGGADGLARAGGADRPPTEEQRHERDERGGPSGLVERIVRTALDNAVERVTVIPGDSWQQRQLRELSWLLDGTGIDMVISTSLDGIAPHRVDVVSQDGRLVIKVGSGSPRGTHAFVKSMVDRVAAAMLLVLVMPLLVAVALAVRLESRGPAIFRQLRVREGGATFTMYKFRTMCVDAEAQLEKLRSLNKHASDGLFKIDNDPRITRVGQVLRRTSLDELPQLLNVLKGQMSLIGPRPALPREVATYDYVARRRLAVKPGMTGLWQVSGRSKLGWDESIGFDLDYVDNWSPGTEVSIAMRTLRAVLTRDGAV